MANLIGTDGNKLFWDDNYNQSGLKSSNCVGIRTHRVPYVITQSDIDAQFTAIPVLWTVPYDDANYTMSWSIVDQSGDIAAQPNYICGDTHNITALGFTAILLVGIYSVPDPGDIVIVTAIAFHD